MATPSIDATGAVKQIGSQRPEFLRVVREDESAVQVKVPEVTRWKKRTALLLDSMPWLYFEPLDKAGHVVGPRVDNEDARSEDEATDLEDLELLTPGSHTSLVALTKLILQAQEVALVRQKQAYDSVLENNTRLLTVIANRLEVMEKRAHNDLETILRLRNEAMGGGGDGESEILGAVAAQLLANQQGGVPQGGAQ